MKATVFITIAFIFLLAIPSFGQARAWKKTHELVQKRQAEYAASKNGDSTVTANAQKSEAKVKIKKFRVKNIRTGNQYAVRYSPREFSSVCSGGNCGGRTDRQRYMRR
jgi:hypothetical protein